MGRDLLRCGKCPMRNTNSNHECLVDKIYRNDNDHCDIVSGLALRMVAWARVYEKSESYKAALRNL